MVQLLHTNRQFTGLSHEDPRVHIQNFLEISDTYTLTGVNYDYVRPTLFPFSLLGVAKRWLNSVPANSITTWDDLARKFKADKLWRRHMLSCLLNRISQGNPEWNGGGTKPVIQKTAGVLEMDAVTNLSAQIAAMQNMMTTHFSNMSLGQQQA
ncbi:uncharacterized protein LOC125845688 [Solanum stenotomum]|uniref:uncharacterized protein LOC125845688 n=1 Tax=Solanum stenotomum TaxID=172797 RepID=UPI0020D1AE48|nr:uncharacterized protein LOC125845688 [Solanum stenotomum]